MNKHFNIDVRIDDKEMHSLALKGANLIITWKGKKIKIPKIKNGYRESHHRTKTELKALKLSPSAPPIGYGLQQFNGDIFYLYDINKVKKYEISHAHKEYIKEYRRRLRERKTCPECKKVYKYVTDIILHYLPSMERVHLCEECHKNVWEEHSQKKRQVKHDFLSYFQNKGIELNVSINLSKSFDTVYLDFETTGLSKEHDEIVQVSIIDDKDRVLLYRLCKPQMLKEWDDAMNINGITPADVENEMPFEHYIDYISNILLRAKTVVCYNVAFELGFLQKYSVKYSEDNSAVKFEDPMLMFAEIYGEYSEYYSNYKWQKLTTAARYYGYDFEGQEHNSLADVFATKYVYEKILTNRNLKKLQNQLKEGK